MNIKLCSYSIFLFLREIPRAGNILLASLCRHPRTKDHASMIPVRGNTAAAATGRGASIMTPVSVILEGYLSLGLLKLLEF
jgi:hypothetical protein